MNSLEHTHESVQDYYGQVLTSTKDLQTNACCSLETIPLHLKQLIKQIEPEVLERFYGCGAPVPTALEGCTVLDLGCGSDAIRIWPRAWWVRKAMCLGWI